MRAVNLLPNERKQADGRPAGGGGALTTTRVAIVGGSLAAIVCGLVGFTFVGARGDVAKKRDALETIRQQVADAQTAAVAKSHQRQQHQQQIPGTPLPAVVQAQLDAFNLVASARVQWDQLLGDVSRVLPKGSWLSSVTLQGAPATTSDPAQSGTTAVSTPTAPTGFVASGFALSQPVVARLLQQLALVPMLSDITLQRSETTSVGADTAYQFTLSANVRLNGASR
jgi:Tfp pilus assembly protein PilN